MAGFSVYNQTARNTTPRRSSSSRRSQQRQPGNASAIRKAPSHPRPGYPDNTQKRRDRPHRLKIANLILPNQRSALFRLKLIQPHNALAGGETEMEPLRQILRAQTNARAAVNFDDNVILDHLNVQLVDIIFGHRGV